MRLLDLCGHQQHGPASISSLSGLSRAKGTSSTFWTCRILISPSARLIYPRFLVEVPKENTEMSSKSALSPLGVKQSTLVAAAGEYYVLARLSLLGKIAAQAPRGVPNADIVVSSVKGDRLCAVQVKSRQGKGGDGGWHM